MRWRRITADGRCDKGGKRPAGDVRPWSESARSLPHPLLHLPRWVTPYSSRRWLTFRPREADWRDCISDRLHPDLPIFFPLPDYQSAGQRQLCRSRRIPLPNPTSICRRLQQAFCPGQGRKEERLYEERRRSGVVGKVSRDPKKNAADRCQILRPSFRALWARWRICRLRIDGVQSEARQTGHRVRHGRNVHRCVSFFRPVRAVFRKCRGEYQDCLSAIIDRDRGGVSGSVREIVGG